MSRKETLVFLLDKKNVLNANSYKGLHWAVKGKITDTLRSEAVLQGSKRHSEDQISLIESRLDALADLASQSVRKARRTKALQKDKDLSAKEIKAIVEEEFSEEDLVSPSSVPVTYLFSHYKIRVTVAPPTRRRLDPVNLYPTVKALIDGLTDSAWWEDDDFTRLLELSFVYGGLSGDKDTFKITMEVEEVEDLSPYVLSA